MQRDAPSQQQFSHPSLSGIDKRKKRLIELHALVLCAHGREL